MSQHACHNSHCPHSHLRNTKSPPASQPTACRSAFGAASHLYHRPWTHQLTRFQLAGVPCAVQAPPRPSKQEAPAGVLPHAPTGRQHAAGPKDAPLKSLFPPELPVPKQVPPFLVCSINVLHFPSMQDVGGACCCCQTMAQSMRHQLGPWEVSHLTGSKSPASRRCSVQQAPSSHPAAEVDTRPPALSGMGGVESQQPRSQDYIYCHPYPGSDACVLRSLPASGGPQALK